jgi:iron complex transport system substrate-binding protein
MPIFSSSSCARRKRQCSEIESLVQHPLWQQMRAPQQGQVWRVDGVAWSLSGGMLGANLMLDDVARLVTADAAS